MFNERLIINRPKSPNYNQSPPSEYISLATSFVHIYLSISRYVALKSTTFSLIHGPGFNAYTHIVTKNASVCILNHVYDG